MPIVVKVVPVTSTLVFFIKSILRLEINRFRFSVFMTKSCNLRLSAIGKLLIAVLEFNKSFTKKLF